MSIVNHKEIKQAKTVGTKLTPREYEEVANLINNGLYLSFSDFLRESIRDKLKATKVIKLRNINYENAKKEILGYYRNYDEAYLSEVSENLELDLELVIQITEELEQEGRLKGV
jgi:Arc/MetJ-type ribon-helix-helix transcriptional regulator